VEWVVSLEAVTSRPFDMDEADRLIEELVTYSPALSGAGRKAGVTMSVEASTPAKALAMAAGAFKRALRGKPRIVGVRIQTVDDLERELEAPSMPALGSVHEFAELLGVSRARASEITRLPDFPQPITRLAAGPVWLRTLLEAWARTHDRKPGRPSAAAS